VQTGILMVASGTASVDARATLNRVAISAEQRFPGIAVRWSYTAAGVRRRLTADGIHIDAPTEALDRMAADGFTHIAVASLHVVAGREYDGVARAAAEVGKNSDVAATVSLGKPLLASDDDLARTAKAILANLPPERTSEEAVILIGHGSAAHPATEVYAAVGRSFAELDPRVFVGTVNGRPTLADVLERCRRSGATRAYLMPFTTVAGHTVRRAVDTSTPSSWTRALAEAGVETVPVLRGLIEHECVAAIWLDHLAEAVEELGVPVAPIGRPARSRGEPAARETRQSMRSRATRTSGSTPG